MQNTIYIIISLFLLTSCGIKHTTDEWPDLHNEDYRFSYQSQFEAISLGISRCSDSNKYLVSRISEGQSEWYPDLKKVITLTFEKDKFSEDFLIIYIRESAIGGSNVLIRGRNIRKGAYYKDYWKTVIKWLNKNLVCN